MKLLIINNTANQGVRLAQKFKYDNVTVLCTRSLLGYTKSSNIVFLNNKIDSFVKLVYYYLWSDSIIFNSPSGRLLTAVNILQKVIPKQLVLYFHGSECRGKDLSYLSSKYDTCFYSTPDLKEFCTGFNEYYHIPCKPIKKRIGDVLVFSRNDDFKKTYKYFSKAKKNPKKSYNFIDWFKNNKYKTIFISQMPDNCELIPTIPNDLVPNYLMGFDEVYGQLSGYKGISEQEIEEFSRKNAKG